MARYRSTAAILLLAASIPAFANAPPWSPTPACMQSLRQALYSLELPLSAADSAAIAPPDSNRAARAERRQLLAAFALTLRNVRYRSGGRAPHTGFDCSGFVHYVFARTLGVELPDDSQSQFHDGTQVARGELRTGDLVFFRTHGKRVSHVGIYLEDGRFIHSPRPGKKVRVDDLHDRYWAQHFAGAKRPNVFI